MACAHGAVWNGVCVACGMNVEPATPLQAVGGAERRQKRKLSTVDAQYGDFDMGAAELERLELEAEQRLLKARKLQLVVRPGPACTCITCPRSLHRGPGCVYVYNRGVAGRPG